jgi:predicted nucleotidyltransferase
VRSVPPSLDAAVVAEIDARIASLDVVVPWAIESGSRAWGFPSPDSDYDCRFIFVRPTHQYLTPWPERDVIETPLDRIFDVNGWDLVKAVRLLMKGNAVIVEWLRSPIVYTGDDDFRTGLLDLADAVGNRALIGRHYLHVGRQKWNAEGGEMALKKIFYSLRPAAVLRWMHTNPDSTLPPMNLQALLEECEPPVDVVAEVADLLALKAVTREIGRGEVPRAIHRFVNEEFQRAYDSFEHADGRVSEADRDRAGSYFRDAVARFGDGASPASGR